jgi:hypothetical protein
MRPRCSWQVNIQPLLRVTAFDIGDIFEYALPLLARGGRLLGKCPALE